MRVARAAMSFSCMVAVIAGILASACARLSKPSAATAAADVQAFLDEVQEGVWTVERVEKTNGRDGVHEGTPAYIMEAKIHVKLNKDKKGWNVFQLIGDTIWLSDIGGKAGQTKVSRPVKITWIQTENGWKFVGAACISC